MTIWSAWAKIENTPVRQSSLNGSTLFIEHDPRGERPYMVYNRTNVGRWPMGSFSAASEARAYAADLWS